MSARRPTKPKPYAHGTKVPSEQSRAELEQLLNRHGATEFMLHRDSERTTVIFRLAGRMVRLRIDNPRKQAMPTQRERDAFDAELRRRWRAQLLIVKAKLELIGSGESTAEREFFADVLLPNGETVHEALAGRLAEAYETGTMPLLLPASTQR